MKGSIFTVLSMENHHPSTLLSMDYSASSHDELDLEMMNNGNRQITLYHPPDINLPLSVGHSSPSQAWSSVCFDNILDVGLSSQACETTETFLNTIPNKVSKKCSKRGNSIWGAWFFFSFYFRPALNEKSKCKAMRDNKGGSFAGLEKSDLKLDVFHVQHDMENIYMWVFKERPENALGKMQLRSYMNGHSREGERPFPFSADKGFVRSHRMQRKHYRGLSNPQCVHGIEFVPFPNLLCISDDDKKRWAELTGRDLNFKIPPEASDFSSWRNLPSTEFVLERPCPASTKAASNSNAKRVMNGAELHLTNHAPPLLHINGDLLDQMQQQQQGGGGKKRKEFLSPGSSEEDGCLTVSTEQATREVPRWRNEFTGVMKDVKGPVTAAKTIYEDQEAYLIMISLPFVDLNSVKVSWRNSVVNGIVKVTGVSTSCAPMIRRRERTFKLAEGTAEHCPQGEFVREVLLPGRIPEDGKIEAYYDGMGAVLEIIVPKSKEEEHEVRVCLRPHLLSPTHLSLT